MEEEEEEINKDYGNETRMESRKEYSTLTSGLHMSKHLHICIHAHTQADRIFNFSHDFNSFILKYEEACREKEFLRCEVLFRMYMGREENVIPVSQGQVPTHQAGRSYANTSTLKS